MILKTENIVIDGFSKSKFSAIFKHSNRNKDKTNFNLPAKGEFHCFPFFYPSSGKETIVQKA